MKKRLTALLLSVMMLGSTVSVLPVTAADTPAYTAETAETDSALMEFLTRIAGWDGYKLDDCIFLNGNLLLTPAKIYDIEKTTYSKAVSRYRVTVKEGTTLSADEFGKKCTVTETPDGYIVDGASYSKLQAMPNVMRLAVSQVYHTNMYGDTNYGTLQGLVIYSDRTLTAADFPALTGVTVFQQEETAELSVRRDEWRLTIDGGNYTDYFNAVKYLQTLDFVKQIVPDWIRSDAYAAADASYSKPYAWNTVYDRVSSEMLSGMDEALADFLTRVAAWDDAAVSDCVLLRQGTQILLLTPKHPYYIVKGRGSQCRVYVQEGTKLTLDDLWGAMEKALAERRNLTGYTEEQELTILRELRLHKQHDCYLAELPEALKQDAPTLSEVLSQFPNVMRTEIPYVYQTDTLRGKLANYTLRFACKRELLAEDVPALSGVTVTAAGTSGLWNLKLESDSYEEYFEAVKLLSAMEDVSKIWLWGDQNGWGETHDDNASEPYRWEATYAAGNSADLLNEFLMRIASWDNASLDDCITQINDNTQNPYQPYAVIYTPYKKYDVLRYRCSNYRVYVDEGTALDPDAILEKWAQMLREAGYPEKNLEQYFKACTLTEADGGYDVSLWQDAYGDITLADCLKTFGNVKKVDAVFCYHTSDRPNEHTPECLSFVSGKTYAAYDLPKLKNITLSDHSPYSKEPDGKQYLTIENGSYADYFSAMKYLQTFEDIRELSLYEMSTALADECEDASLIELDRTVLYELETPVLPVYGSFDAGDPLYNDQRYVFADELPEGTDGYFTGLVTYQGEPSYHYGEDGWISFYSDYGGNHYVGKTGTPLTIGEAKALCAEIKERFADGEFKITEPKLVWVKGMPCTVTGDLNNDNTVTIADAKMLLDRTVWYSINGYHTIPLKQTLPTADVNGDGEVDISDVKYILDYAVYALTFGKNPEWSSITAYKAQVPADGITS